MSLITPQYTRRMEITRLALLRTERNELRKALKAIEHTLLWAKPVDYKRDCFTALKIAQTAINKATP